MNLNSERIQYRRAVDQAGFAQLCHLVTLDTELNDGAVRLYLLLLKYAQDKGNCWPGIKRLARELGKSEPTIKRRMAELVERGLITRQQRLNTSAITWLEDLEEVYSSVSIKNDTDVSIKNDTDMSVSKMMPKQETEEQTNMKNGDDDGIKKRANLLTAFGVNGPVARKLAQTRNLNQVEGWIDYATDAEYLRNPAGFVVKMLRDDEQPPECRPENDDRQQYRDWYDEEVDRWLEKERRKTEPARDPSVSAKIGNTTADRIWSGALCELELQMTQATFDAWLRDSKLMRFKDDTFVVGVVSEYAKDWLDHRLLDTIKRTLARLIGQSTAAVEFVTTRDEGELFLA